MSSSVLSELAGAWRCRHREMGSLGNGTGIPPAPGASAQPWHCGNAGLGLEQPELGGRLGLCVHSVCWMCCREQTLGGFPCLLHGSCISGVLCCECACRHPGSAHLCLCPWGSQPSGAGGVNHSFPGGIPHSGCARNSPGGCSHADSGIVAGTRRSSSSCSCYPRPPSPQSLLFQHQTCPCCSLAQGLPCQERADPRGSCRVLQGAPPFPLRGGTHSALADFSKDFGGDLALKAPCAWCMVISGCSEAERSRR